LTWRKQGDGEEKAADAKRREDDEVNSLVKKNESGKGGELSKRVLFSQEARDGDDGGKDKSGEEAKVPGEVVAEKNEEGTLKAAADVNSALSGMHVDQVSPVSGNEVSKEGGKKRGTYKKVERADRAARLAEKGRRVGEKRGVDDVAMEEADDNEMRGVQKKQKNAGLADQSCESQ